MRAVEECYRSDQVRIFRLDREGVLARLGVAAARAVAERPELIEVILFGSLARGDAAPGSDADLALIVTHSDRRFHDRSMGYAPYFEDAGVGCDVFVYTTTERQTLASVPSLLRTALAEGRTLAHR